MPNNTQIRVIVFNVVGQSPISNEFILKYTGASVDKPGKLWYSSGFFYFIYKMVFFKRQLYNRTINTSLHL